MTDQFSLDHPLFPTDWELDAGDNRVKYATDQCKQKCICSKEEQIHKQELCHSFHLPWRFEDYYEVFIVKNRVLCELFEEFVYSSVAYNEEEHSYDFTGEMSYNVKEVIICLLYTSRCV